MTGCVALIDFVREQAELENREYGVRMYQGGYEFMLYDDRVEAVDSREGRTRHARPRAAAVARSARSPSKAAGDHAPRQDAKDLAPQILLFSSGDLNDFELTVKRRGETGISCRAGARTSYRRQGQEPAGHAG